MESWTDHLREASRLSRDDRAVLARAAAFQRDGAPPLPVALPRRGPGDALLAARAQYIRDRLRGVFGDRTPICEPAPRR